MEGEFKRDFLKKRNLSKGEEESRCLPGSSEPEAGESQGTGPQAGVPYLCRGQQGGQCGCRRVRGTGKR